MIWFLLAATALAESWCAAPLTVHEWGVQAFNASGDEVRGTGIPDWFHRDVQGGVIASGFVRNLPPDSGIRDLPVLQFYGPGVYGDEIPVAVEVGFTQGEASAWWPQVSLRRSAAKANSPEAQARLAELKADREKRAPFAPAGANKDLLGDPTAQLAWDGLVLKREVEPIPNPSGVKWVQDLRDIDALWVSNGTQKERFVFYEAETTESPALTLERGDSWTPGRPHYLLRNTSDWAVHDVFLSAEGFVFYAPSIPRGATAGFLLNEHIDADPLGTLRQLLIDPGKAAPTDKFDWSVGCEMMRDPAIPQSKAEGHQLYAAEVDVMLDVWEDRFFGDSPTLVYREDVAALEALMPLNIYTDMYHHVQLRRLGMVVVDGVEL